MNRSASTIALEQVNIYAQRIAANEKIQLTANDQETLSALCAEVRVAQHGNTFQATHPLWQLPRSFTIAPTKDDLQRAFIEEAINQKWREKMQAVQQKVERAITKELRENYPNAKVRQPDSGSLLQAAVKVFVQEWIEKNATIIDLLPFETPSENTYSFAHAEAKGAVTIRRNAYGLDIIVNGEEKAMIDLFYCATEGKAALIRTWDENGDTQETIELC